jgi:hypothetical protein
VTSAAAKVVHDLGLPSDSSEEESPIRNYQEKDPLLLESGSDTNNNKQQTDEVSSMARFIIIFHIQ